MDINQLYRYIRHIMRIHRQMQKYIHKLASKKMWNRNRKQPDRTMQRKEHRTKDGSMFWGCGL